MLLLELLATVAVAAAPQTSALQAAPAPRPASVIDIGRVARCDGRQFIQVADKAPAPPARRLGDLPKANFELAVNRTVGGCVKPAVVSYGVGK